MGKTLVKFVFESETLGPTEILNWVVRELAADNEMFATLRATRRLRNPNIKIVDFKVLDEGKGMGWPMAQFIPRTRGDGGGMNNGHSYFRHFYT